MIKILYPVLHFAAPVGTSSTNTATGHGCALNSALLGFPHWYQYLPTTTDNAGQCLPVINSVGNVWLILAAVIEIMLRIATLLAIGYVVYGGIQFITSQGEPDKSAKARETVFNAIIGLVIAVVAASAVAFIAGRFSNHA